MDGDARFCGECGQPPAQWVAPMATNVIAPATVFCATGHEIPEATPFCDQCGSPAVPSNSNPIGQNLNSTAGVNGANQSAQLVSNVTSAVKSNPKLAKRVGIAIAGAAVAVGITAAAVNIAEITDDPHPEGPTFPIYSCGQFADVITAYSWQRTYYPIAIYDPVMLQDNQAAYDAGSFQVPSGYNEAYLLQCTGTAKLNDATHIGIHFYRTVDTLGDIIIGWESLD